MTRSSLAADLRRFAWRALLWITLPGFALFMPPVAAFLFVTLLGTAFLWRYALRPAAVRERAALRLRPVRAPAALLAAGAVASVALLVLVEAAYTLALEQRPEPTRLDEVIRQPGMWPALILLAVAVGPFIEEAVFRGWLQRSLERRVGAILAVATSALVFAAAHLEVRGIPVRFLTGAYFGAAVYVTRSLWSGVALHGSSNATVGAFTALGVSPERVHDALGGSPWTLALAIIAAAAAALCVALRLHAICGERHGPTRRLPPRVGSGPTGVGQCAPRFILPRR